MKIDKAEIKKILFITLNNLGDIILTTPVLDVLCRNFPKAEIDVITGFPGKEIFDKHSAVRNILIRQKGIGILERIKEIMTLRGKKYDLTVDMKNSLIPWMIGAKYRPGTLLFNKNEKHKKEEHLTKLVSMNLDITEHTRFFMPITDADKRLINRYIEEKGKGRLAVINPGAKSHLKRWDVKKFSELSDRMAGELDLTVFVTGNEDDDQVIETFKENTKEKVVDMSGRTSLGALAELIKRSDIIVTNDSAPLHIASAVGTKTVAIFGPSDEKKYGPLSQGSIVVTPDKKCRPCSKALCSEGPDEGCISEISVEEVFEAVKKVLAV